MIVVDFFKFMENQAKAFEELSKFQKQAYKSINQAQKVHELLKDTPFESQKSEIIKSVLESIAESIDHLLEDMDKPKGKRVDLDKPMIDWKGEPHCEYCDCPGPKPIMRTYDGDTCQIYYDYRDVKESFGSASFTLEELTLKCRDAFLGKYPDVPDFDETVKEMLIEVDTDDLGIVCRNEDDLFRLV